MSVVYIAIGFVLGSLVAWLWLRGQSMKDRAVLEERTRAADEKLALVGQAKDALTQEFERVANRIVDEKGRKLLGENRTKLEEVLKPFKDQLGDFRQRVNDVYDKEGKERASLLTEIKLLRELNNQVSQRAEDLTHALEGQSKTRGDWGEMVVETVLESSGLVPNVEYETQVHLTDKYGGDKRRYPDFVVHLPNQRDVIIDAKVALVAYKRYCSAKDDAERAQALKEHVSAVRGHMKDLSSKTYQDLEGIRALDQVIMCVPNEPAYMTAAAEDPNLHDDAIKERILIVSPTTLVLTLKIIAAMWRTDRQNKNALEIARRGQLLFDKFAGFVDDLTKVERSLKAADDACAEAKKKLSEGHGNLVAQSQTLLKLGVKATKSLPFDMVDRAADESNA